jgi:hypothetical protein
MASATVYDAYAAANARLVRGERIYFDPFLEGRPFTSSESSRSKRVSYPKIGIYTGTGSSHSWLWFVDLFDRMGFHDLYLLDAAAIQNQNLEFLDVLTVSGGDTFAIAQALGPAGARRLRTFIENGGLYIGSCAGAYLVMRSSKPHLNLFNFTSVRITNLSKWLPACRGLAHKFSQAYGCDYIFHPVRDAVTIGPTGQAPFWGTRPLDAPLFGGPGMIPSDTDRILARYKAFTNRTQYLVDETIARETLLGKAAAIRASMGKGHLYLLGPHFEHPHFQEANQLVADAIFWDGGRLNRDICQAPKEFPTLAATASQSLLKTLKRELSNSRIVAVGMEMMPVRWLIGNKYYDPQKIRVFLDAIWHRIKPLEKNGPLRTEPGLAVKLSANAEKTTGLLRELKHRLDETADTASLARDIFKRLPGFTTAFLGLYFQTIGDSHDLIEDNTGEQHLN